ncbi:hypothetical protein EB118_19165 [bacterium]|nr:hypothetical protein [bacterium]NDD83688.1 hypothetical protein [bacterium]NDG32183.1 hypothetical protein [bacterium]
MDVTHLLTSSDHKGDPMMQKQHIKRGDTVRIIRFGKSPFNYYIGYIGEVKEYRPNQTHAMVFLQATAEPRWLYLPIQHLSKL